MSYRDIFSSEIVHRYITYYMTDLTVQHLETVKISLLALYNKETFALINSPIVKT